MSTIEHSESAIPSTDLKQQSAQIDITKTNRGYRLQTRQCFSHAITEVFPFFADAGNLEEITPDYLNFHIVTPLPIEMRPGALIDYRLRLHLIPIKWRTEITAWEPPHRFVDQQLRGPYKFWHHEHLFSEHSGVTTVTDIVDYGVALGFIMHPLLVSHDLKRIFAYRRAALARHF